MRAVAEEEQICLQWSAFTSFMYCEVTHKS